MPTTTDTYTGNCPVPNTFLNKSLWLEDKLQKDCKQKATRPVE